MLKIQALGKRYDQQAALTAVDLHIHAGETFGLIGLNGAGKSTLIKCILDLHRADSGHIAVAGIGSAKHQARQQLTYLPEKFTPPDYMSGYLYLQYINDAHRQAPLAGAQLQQQAHGLCAELELPLAALNRSVKTYSKGMLQKLGLIGCILSDKPLLVLDEPMSGLDPKARVLFRQTIQRLKQAGKTMLFCTHILNDIALLCDRVGILHEGHLLFAGTPQQCCERFTADNLEAAFLNSLKNKQ